MHLHVLDVYEARGLRPTVPALHTALHLAVEAQSERAVADVLERMAALGMAHTEYTYAILIRYHIGREELAQAVRLFNGMLKAGVKVDGAVLMQLLFLAQATRGQVSVESVMSLARYVDVTLDRRQWTVLLRVLSELRPSRVPALFQEMLTAKVVPDARVFNALIKHHASGNNLHEVTETVKQMHRRHVEPDAETYQLLMAVYADFLFTAGADRLLSDMRSAPSVTPTWHTYLLAAQLFLKAHGEATEAAANATDADVDVSDNDSAASHRRERQLHERLTTLTHDLLTKRPLCGFLPLPPLPPYPCLSPSCSPSPSPVCLSLLLPPSHSFSLPLPLPPIPSFSLSDSLSLSSRWCSWWRVT